MLKGIMDHEAIRDRDDVHIFVMGYARFWNEMTDWYDKETICAMLSGFIPIIKRRHAVINSILLRVSSSNSPTTRRYSHGPYSERRRRSFWWRYCNAGFLTVFFHRCHSLSVPGA
jgi:hypothetical protein